MRESERARERLELKVDLYYSTTCWQNAAILQTEPMLRWPRYWYSSAGLRGTEYNQRGAAALDFNFRWSASCFIWRHFYLMVCNFKNHARHSDLVECLLFRLPFKSMILLLWAAMTARARPGLGRRRGGSAVKSVWSQCLAANLPLNSKGWLQHGGGGGVGGVSARRLLSLLSD